MNNSNNLDYFTLYIIFSIAFMLITLLVILIAKPSTGLGEVLVTINLLNALVWLAINLVNGLLAVNAWIIEGKALLRK